VAGAPVKFSTSYSGTNTATEGALVPSNIIQLNGFYYVFLYVAGNTTGTGGATQTAGDCLLQSSNLADPTAWRAWDGTGFNIQFMDPYTTPNISSMPIATTGCTVVNPTNLQGPVRSLMAMSNDGTIVGYVASLAGSTYAEASTSSDLIHWSSPVSIVNPNLTPFVTTCTGPSPFYAYPTFLDSASGTTTDRNFNIVNVNSSTTYIYATQFVDCEVLGNLNRNLIRVPVTITY